MVHQMFPLKQGGIDFLPMISLITVRRGFICYGKRSENFYSRSHKSPLFTVESTMNLTYQMVMQASYKPSEILSNAQ